MFFLYEKKAAITTMEARALDASVRVNEVKEM